MATLETARIRLRRTRLWLAVLLLTIAAATPAAAWKPKTHIYLAEQVRIDAIDDGKVTIYETDHATGKVVGTLGAFEVNPAVLAALRAKPEQFRAGVVGPDAYPDILTGQQLIHPGTNKSLLGEPAHGELPSADGSDAWLTHLWRKAYGRKSAMEEMLGDAKLPGGLGIVRNDTAEIRAFVAGYVTHAAGDMFMHTFVNHYTGGDFAISPDPKNAVKHVVLEGYVGVRTPSFRARVSIDGVDGFIYREMVRASPGSLLAERLLQGAGDKASIPAIFSQLRNGLQRDVDAYERERMSRSGPSRVAYAAANGPEAEYKKAWIEDIDNGLRAWPKVSHDIAVALVYDGADAKAAKEIATQYLFDHLLSMAGAPDAAVATVDFIRKVMAAILPKAVTEAISQITRAPLDWMIKEATGKSLDEWSAYMKDPQIHFDPVMNAPGGGYGGEHETLITLTDFNRKVLGIDDPGMQFPDKRFKIDSFPPAFNTVQMTKLAFLSEKGMNDLLAALKKKGVNAPAAPGLAGKYESAMLGFLTSLDGGNRWQGTSPGGARTGAAFFLARGDAGGWKRLFMKQVGEREGWTENTAPAQETPPTLDDTGFVANDWWAVRLDETVYGAKDGSGRNVFVTATFRNDTAQPLPFNDKTLRTVIQRNDGLQVALLRMGFVHQTEDALPAWHYLPNAPIPPKGRITVRFVYDVGDKAAQQAVKAWTVFEQRPQIKGLSIKYVDGKSVQIPLPPLEGGRDGPLPPPDPQINGGVASTAFIAAGDLSYRLDAAGRRKGPTGPIEVALTARGARADKAISLQTAYHSYALIGSDGVEYPTNGNFYIRTGDEPMKTGRSLRQGEEAAFTLVFSKPPASVKAARLIVRSYQKAVLAEFYLDGAPLTRPVSAPLTPAAGGIPAGAAVPLKRFEARVISVNRGDDRDWEMVIGLKGVSGIMTKVTASDIGVALMDAHGETRQSLGSFYRFDSLGRTPMSETLMLPKGIELPVRLWFPESAALAAPAGYTFHESYGLSKGGPISAAFVAGADR